jgi:hypothetical protein
MFDVLDRPLLWIPVRWSSLRPGGEDPDALAVPVEHEIEVRIEIKDTPDLAPLATPEPGKEMQRLDALMTYATDWRKVVSGGKPFPFNRENADAFLRAAPAFFDRFHVAYLMAVVGRVETREGNSDASPSDGRAGEAESGTTAKPSSNGTVAASG